MILKHIPNILTVFRLFLVFPLVMFAWQKQYLYSVFVLVLSGFTDILDGFIARKYNLISDFGKLLDPFADKLVQLSILIVLTLQEIFPYWVLCIVGAKELMMILGATFLYEKDTVVSSSWYGKLATVVFYLAMILAMLKFEYYIYFVYIALVLTLFALVMYFNKFMRKKKEINT